ncbi:MAG: glycosyltransferase family 4 protein [Gemmataceae bacterium]
MSLSPIRRVAVLQDGARMHYGLPLALQRAGLLDRVFTEFYSSPGSVESSVVRWLSKWRPALAKRMALRYCSELELDKIVRNPWLLAPQQLAKLGATSAEAHFRRCTDVVGRWVRRVGLGRADAFVGFVRNVDPKLCRYARRRGLTVVGDQIIAPAFVENRECRIQTERFPNWESPPALTSVRALERATWDECDHLTAPSEYVRDGLIEEGVDAAKISVLPYPVAPDWFRPTDRRGVRGGVTVGFVGTVNLRKGIPYLFDTARRLPNTNFRFVAAGPIQLHAAVVAQHKGPVEVIGRVSRQDVARLLDEFDIFYFPSTCEGSAGSVMEAMMAGLPVVCSPNTGSLVRDGIDGYLVDYDDTERAAELLAELARDPERRLAMGRSARERAVSFSVDHYSRMWIDLFDRLSRQNACKPKCGS